MNIRSFIAITILFFGLGMVLAVIITNSSPSQTDDLSRSAQSFCARAGMNCG